MTRPEVMALPVHRVDGRTTTVHDLLDTTYTDSFAVTHRGVVVAQHYAPGCGPDRAHPTWSITKSLVGCVAGVLIHRGVLDETTPVEELIPELRATGYAGATPRHLLDMRSGVAFREEYDDPDSDIGRLERWLSAGRGLYPFLATLEADGPHGGPFRYRSSETDVLGWVCERASGSAMADLLRELVWQPLGAEHAVEMSCDPLGTAIHDSGLAATAPDLLRFGQMLLSGGAVVDATGGKVEVLPAPFVREGWAVDADARRAFLASPAERAFPGGWYRNQCWFRPGPVGDVLLCLGIHGQVLYVSRRTSTVCVKLSSWPTPQNPAALADTLRACDAISASLAGFELNEDVHRLRGVVAGLNRRAGGGLPGPHVV